MNWNEMQGLQGLKPALDVVPISYALETIDTKEGQARVAEVLRQQPFPHFEADPANAEILIRIEADGTRTRGRFVGREFRAE